MANLLHNDSAPVATRGYLAEIFCSTQGEGLFVGERQIFCRTAGCGATCYWCDTVSSKRERSVFIVHGRERVSCDNPVTVEIVAGEIARLANEHAPVRTVSITGGEPLEQPDFVAALAATLRTDGFRIYLETSGLEPEGLLRVASHCDVVAMDIKLPSATGVEHWQAHERFLRSLPPCAEAFVKVVVDSDTPMTEIEEAVRIIAETDPALPLVFQPESSTYLKSRRGAEGRALQVDVIESAQVYALQHLADVRIIPQCHKIMKVR